MGYSKDDSIKNAFRGNIHPDDEKLAWKTLREGYKKGVGECLLRAKDKQGNYHWFDIKGKTFLTTDGQKKGLLLGRDITESRNANIRLKESEKRYRHLFENSPYGILLIDPKGNLVDCNPEFVNSFDRDSKTSP